MISSFSVVGDGLAWQVGKGNHICIGFDPCCCASFVTLVRKIEVLASLVGFAKQDSCKEKG
jgi:hypothetical protein